MAVDTGSSNSLFTHIASRELFRGSSLSNSIFTGKLSRRFLTLFLCSQFENDREWTDSSPPSTTSDPSPYSTTPKTPFLSLCLSARYSLINIPFSLCMRSFFQCFVKLFATAVLPRRHSF